MRTALVSLMSFGLAWVVPQLPGLRGGIENQAAVNATSVQEYLELSGAQQRGLEGLAARLRAKSTDSQRDLESKQKALRMQLASDRADALAAGKALLELEVAKHRSQRTSDEIRNEALALLSPEQREKLRVLEQAAKLHSLTRQAMGMFLIPPPDAVLTGTGPLGMFPAKKRAFKPEFQPTT